MQKYILSVIVRNNAGVLARVSSLFGRRNFNIDSLTVSAMTDPTMSRMSIIVRGDEATLEQIIKQLSKLEEAISVEQLSEVESFCEELLLVKIRAEYGPLRDSIREVAEVYHANIVESTQDLLIVEFTAVPSRIDAFLTVVSNFEVVEICRSGVTAMAK